jgi:hypothetical protein
MSQPISLTVLTHSGTHYPYTGTVNSVKTYGTANSLTAVRFNPVKEHANTSLGDQRNDKFNFVYDCVNSQPSGVTFIKDDKFVFGGMTLIARRVKPCYAGGTEIHHWEVSCV